METLIETGTPEEQLIDVFNQHGEVSFKVFELDNNEIAYIEEALLICLREIEKEYLHKYISYNLKEIVINAKKANIKRVFFRMNGLDINNNAQYNKGMKGFKEKIMPHLEDYTNTLVKENLWIVVRYKVVRDHLFLEVLNNTPILKDELFNARNKIKQAMIFNSLDEAFSVVDDNLEGAGLGMIILILSLKKMGLSEKNFYIGLTDNNETYVRLKIPLSLVTEEHGDIINELILKEIDTIPQFPDKIIKLQKMIKDNDADLRKISFVISSDPGLSADLLKFSNSSFYMFPKKITTIMEAIKILGTRGLNNILYTYGITKVLEKKFRVSEMKQLWEHSFKVGYYSLILARKYLDQSLIEDTYNGGILHDLGKILILGINPDFEKKINEICHLKDIPVKVIEDLMKGYNHSVIGAMMGRKWNFPDTLVDVIQFHHDPQRASGTIQPVVNCIYLANTIAQDTYINNLEKFTSIDYSVLDFFKIKDFSEFNFISEKLELMYNKEVKKAEK